MTTLTTADRLRAAADELDRLDRQRAALLAGLADLGLDQLAEPTVKTTIDAPAKQPTRVAQYDASTFLTALKKSRRKMSINELIDMTGASKNTVKKHCQSLVDAGAIVRTNRPLTFQIAQKA